MFTAEHFYLKCVIFEKETADFHIFERNSLYIFATQRRRP